MAIYPIEQTKGTHDLTKCFPEPCPIHMPSGDGEWLTWPLYVSVSASYERPAFRMCKHGIYHPDIDWVYHVAKKSSYSAKKALHSVMKWHLMGVAEAKDNIGLHYVEDVLTSKATCCDLASEGEDLHIVCCDDMYNDAVTRWPELTPWLAPISYTDETASKEMFGDIKSTFPWAEKVPSFKWSTDGKPVVFNYTQTSADWVTPKYTWPEPGDTISAPGKNGEQYLMEVKSVEGVSIYSKIFDNIALQNGDTVQFTYTLTDHDGGMTLEAAKQLEVYINGEKTDTKVVKKADPHGFEVSGMVTKKPIENVAKKAIAFHNVKPGDSVRWQRPEDPIESGYGVDLLVYVEGINPDGTIKPKAHLSGGCTECVKLADAFKEMLVMGHPVEGDSWQRHGSEPGSPWEPITLNKPWSDPKSDPLSDIKHWKTQFLVEQKYAPIVTKPENIAKFTSFD